MYLDDWPERFEGVHVAAARRRRARALEHHQVPAAANGTDRVWVDDVPLVFFHFHSLKLSERFGRESPADRISLGSSQLLWSSRYPRSSDEERLVWLPYLEALGDALALIRTVEPDFAEGFAPARDLVRQSINRLLGHVVRGAAGLPARLKLPRSGVR